MTLALQMLLRRLHRPMDDGNDLPGADEDYGDDFVADTDDDPAPRYDGGGAEADLDGADAGADDGDDGDGEDLRSAVSDEVEGRKDTGTPKTKGKFIPLDRHEKMLRKERARREAAEAELSKSRVGQQVVQANESLARVEDELVSMEAKYNDLLAEGDTEAAARMMTQIRRKNAELQSVTAAQRDAEVMARAVEKVRFDEALDRIEQEYPALDPDSVEYDEEVYQDVYDLMIAGRNRGLNPTKALQRAVERTLGATTAGQRRVTTVTPRVDEGDVAGRRRSEAVRRNLDAARRTPPATHRTGAGSGTAGGALTPQTVMRMSEEEFDKLSDRDLARLRGDEL